MTFGALLDTVGLAVTSRIPRKPEPAVPFVMFLAGGSTTVARSSIPDKFFIFGFNVIKA
jgi:hypothetical protein